MIKAFSLKGNLRSCGCTWAQELLGKPDAGKLSHWIVGEVGWRVGVELGAHSQETLKPATVKAQVNHTIPSNIKLVKQYCVLNIPPASRCVYIYIQKMQYTYVVLCIYIDIIFLKKSQTGYVGLFFLLKVKIYRSRVPFNLLLSPFPGIFMLQCHQMYLMQERASTETNAKVTYLSKVLICGIYKLFIYIWPVEARNGGYSEEACLFLFLMAVFSRLNRSKSSVRSKPFRIFQ